MHGFHENSQNGLGFIVKRKTKKMLKKKKKKEKNANERNIKVPLILDLKTLVEKYEYKDKCNN